MVTALMVKPGEQPCSTQINDDRDFLNCAVSIGANAMCNAEVITVEKGSLQSMLQKAYLQDCVATKRWARELLQVRSIL